jgi:hypothetical protein
MRPDPGDSALTSAPPELLARVQQAFDQVPRPEHFTNYTHCCECFEHDETLRAATPDTIGLPELGNAGWDPICFISVEGFHYYMPALARLALGRGPEYYLDQFLGHLRWPPERIARMTADQRAALHHLLEYIFDTRFEEIEELDREWLVHMIIALSE